MQKTKKKNRVFILKNGKKPLSYTLGSNSTKRRQLIAIVKDEDGSEVARQIRYSRVHSTPFMDEQKGDLVLDPIVFYDGALVLDPVRDSNLIKFMEITPDNGTLFEELDREREADEEVNMFKVELEAMNFADRSDIEMLIPIIADITGKNVSAMTSSEIKRDALIYAKRDPELFLSYRNNPQVHVRSIMRDAMEYKLLTLRNSETAWHKNFEDDKKKFLDVKFEEDANEVLQYWLSNTKEGADMLNTLESLINEKQNS